MPYNVLILGASYGSLLGTKLLMAGHNVTLVCRRQTAELINAEGTEVRIKLKGEDEHRRILSKDLPGKLAACTPQEIEAGGYDLVGLAMQEPQYVHHSLRTALVRIAEQRIVEALERGELDRLPGAGKPLVLDDDSQVPEAMRVAYRVLRNAGLVPEEVSLRRELEDLELAAADAPDAMAADAHRRLTWIRARLEARGMRLSVCGYDRALVERMAR